MYYYSDEPNYIFGCANFPLRNSGSGVLSTLSRSPVWPNLWHIELAEWGHHARRRSSLQIHSISHSEWKLCPCALRHDCNKLDDHFSTVCSNKVSTIIRFHSQKLITNIPVLLIYLQLLTIINFIIPLGNYNSNRFYRY